MADLINRQMAIDTIADYERDSTAPIDYKAIIKALPTVDAVEVVRCKNCKYSVDFYDNDIGTCCCCRPNRVLEWIGDWDFYCKAAERREDDKH